MGQHALTHFELIHESTDSFFSKRYLVLRIILVVNNTYGRPIILSFCVSIGKDSLRTVSTGTVYYLIFQPSRILQETV